MARVEDWLASRNTAPAVSENIQVLVAAAELVATSALIRVMGHDLGASAATCCERIAAFSAEDRQRVFERAHESATRTTADREKERQSAVLSQLIERVEALLRGEPAAAVAPKAEAPAAASAPPPGHRQLRAPGLSEAEQRLLPGLPG